MIDSLIGIVCGLGIIISLTCPLFILLGMGVWEILLKKGDTNG